MSWVRIHDGAMVNQKITALSDSAFRLWVRGLSYCQTALTDGLIPRQALRDMGAKPKDIAQLSAVLVEGRAPLWERHDVGFKVHDYLTWNDCREKVQARQAAAHQRKEAYNERRSERVPNTSENASRTLRALNGEPNLTKPNHRRFGSTE